jgi:hypothetical protein
VDWRLVKVRVELVAQEMGKVSLDHKKLRGAVPTAATLIETVEP